MRPSMAMEAAAFAYVRIVSPSHNNIRYFEILPLLRMARGYHFNLSRIRAVRGPQHRLLRLAWLRTAAFRALGRRHACILAADTGGLTWDDIVTAFPGKAVVDIDDPVFSPDETHVLNERRVIAVVTTTDVLRAALHANGVNKPIYVIPQCVPDSLLTYQPPPGRAARDDEFVVGVAQPHLNLDEGPSEHVQNYRIDQLLDVLGAIRHRLPQLRLELLGRPSPALTRHVRAFSWVRLQGYQPHHSLPAFMGKWDIAAYPRSLDWGGRFSIKLLEYMALGRAIVSSDVAEALLLREANTGVIAQSQLEWQDAIVALASDAETRARHGARGRQFASGFAATAVAQRYDALLTQLFADAGHRRAPT